MKTTQDSEYIGLLKSVSIFSHLDLHSLENLSHSLQAVKYGKDAEVFSQDCEGDALYIVRKGRVKVVLRNENGREIILTTFKAGDFFGEMSLLEEEPRSAGVVTIEKAELLRLSRTDFINHLRTNPTASLKILAVMSARLRRASEIIGNLATLDVYGRMARALIDMAKEDGEPRDDGIYIKHRPTQQDLASMIGTTRETVSRVLSEFQKRGLLMTQGKAILLSYGFAEKELSHLRPG